MNLQKIAGRSLPGAQRNVGVIEKMLDKMGITLKIRYECKLCGDEFLTVDEATKHIKECKKEC